MLVVGVDGGSASSCGREVNVCHAVLVVFVVGLSVTSVVVLLRIGVLEGSLWRYRGCGFAFGRGVGVHWCAGARGVPGDGVVRGRVGVWSSLRVWWFPSSSHSFVSG